MNGYMRNIHGTHFSWGLIQPEESSEVGTIKKIEKSSDLIQI
jgi:hypothetical protein